MPATGPVRASASSSTTSSSPPAKAAPFEAGLDGWAVTGAPPGSATNANDWIRTTAAGFPVGAAITTPRTIIMGFGVEGISTPAERNAVMGRAMEYLLP